MNNYINIRLQPANHIKNKNRIKHNLRTVHTQSKVDKSYNNYENNTYNFQNLEPLKILQKWRAEHNKLYKENRYKTVNGKQVKRNENLTNSNSSILEGIITFSEQIKVDLGYKYSKKEYEETCINVVKDIAKYLKTEIMYITFHYDETTPHVHYHFKNYDEKGYSIFNKINNADALSKLQDIGYKHLKELGMQRGEKKEKTGKTHQQTAQYYKRIQKQKIEELKKIRKATQALNLEKEQAKQVYKEITLMQKESRQKLKKYEEVIEQSEAYLKAQKNELEGYEKELKIFDKLANNEVLNEEEKEVLKALAPAMFQFLNKNDTKGKKQLNNKIVKALK